MIRTVPSGAEVYVNGEYLGTSPVEYSDTKVVLSTNQVRLQSVGYETATHSFSRNEKLNILMAIGTVFIIVPAIWLFDYKPERTYHMHATERTTPQQAPEHP